LKAGDLYPTYDAITSTEIFFTNTPKSTLRFDTSDKVQVLDSAVLTSGPDMGKTATVIYIDGSNAVIKLDKDGKAYQEVKYVSLDMLAKNPDVDSRAMFKKAPTSKSGKSASGDDSKDDKKEKEPTDTKATRKAQ
jgi:hypothetical protein